MKKYKYFLILLLIVIIIIIINKNDLLENENIVESDNIKEVDKTFDDIYIDIKGAINNPGVYKVDEDTIVSEVIEKAGGLLDDADTSIINLAKRVNDGDLIIIYTKEEVENSNIKENVVKVIDKECVCPNIQNDACINDTIDDTITNVEEELSSSDKININTATKEELLQINGIGDVRASAIIKYREENGNFKNIEDIKNVDGIGNTLYEKIKDYITL